MVNSPDALSVSTGWLRTMRVYVMWLAPAMLVWEVAQFPLYTLWWTGTPREIGFAALHCTLGDILTGTAALSWALLLVGEPTWPRRGFRHVMFGTLVISVAYTVYSEWLNVTVHQTWAYTDAMPRLPFFDTGLAPFLQWAVLPTLALVAARHSHLRHISAP